MDDDTQRQSRENIPSGHMPDHFDRTLGVLDGLPDAVKTRAATVRHIPPMGIGGIQTFVLQTVRQREVKENAGGEDVARGRDTVFLEAFGPDGAIRLVLPPAVVDTIVRQRESLTTTTRSRTAKRVAQERKDRGEVPGFMKTKKGGRK